MAQPQSQQQRTAPSGFQMVLNHLRDSRSSLTAAGTVLSNMVFELQKVEDSIARWEHNLIKTIEDAGGSVNVEEEIKAFIPTIYRRPTGENTQQ